MGIDVRQVNLAVYAVGLSMAVMGCGGGGGSEVPPPTTLERVQSLLSSYDASWASSAPQTGAQITAFSDACSLDSGYTKQMNIARFDEDVASARAANAYRVGSVRKNVQVLGERNVTNSDSSSRNEIDIQYDIQFADGSVDNGAKETLISGSSAGSSPGSCATPENSATLRFFGNRRVVGVSARGRNIRDQRYVLATGASHATPLTYRREVQLNVSDPAGLATYAIVTGPGPTNTIGGAVTPFSFKMLSPRILRSDPLLTGKGGNSLNWSDEDSFRTCRAPASVAGSGIPVASVADCVGQGTQGPTWGWTLSNPSSTNTAAADTGFATLGFVAGGTYTFAIYADDGWKTVNGQAGKTPIATYTAVLELLPYTFVQMAGTGAEADLFPRATTTSLTPSQIAATVRSGEAASFSAAWTQPGALADGRAFRLGEVYEYFDGPSAANAPGMIFPNYRYFNATYPGSTATSGSVPISAKPSVISTKFYGEFGLTYTDRNNTRIMSLVTFR